MTDREDRQRKNVRMTREKPRGEKASEGNVLHSHWSGFNEAQLSLVESFRVLLRQQSYAIKNQLEYPNSKAHLVFYGMRAPIIDPFVHGSKLSVCH